MEKLDSEKKKALGSLVCGDYQIDYDANSERFTKIRKIMACVLDSEAYQAEFANTRVGSYILPLLTTAAIDFNSVAYPAILSDGEPVKCSYYGVDETGEKAGMAELYSGFGSWQLCDDIEHWKDDLDKLMMMLPNIGCLFKKVYPRGYKKDVSSDLIMPYQLVVHPSIKSLADAPRITQVVEYYKHEVVSKINSGEWKGVKISDFKGSGDDVEKLNPEATTEDMGDDKPLIFLEQHRRYDLDGDGYPEPVIVTVHRDSQAVVSVENNYLKSEAVYDEGKLICAEPIQYFVKFGFFKDPAGSFYDIGFGQIFYENMDAVQSAVNMLLDSAHRANMHTGLIGKGGVRLQGGKITLEQGTFKFIESYGAALRDNVIEFESKEPSPVLMNLLGYMVDFIKNTTSMQNSMMGEGASNQKATTTLGIMEQGIQQYKAILQRIRDSLSKEVKMIFNFNLVAFRKPNPYGVTFINDIDETAIFLQPTFDIHNLTSTVRLAKSQVLVDMSNTGLAQELNLKEIAKEVVTGLRMGAPSRFVKEEPSEPEIMLQMEQEKNNAIYAELELQKENNKKLELEIRASVESARIEKMKKEVDKLDADIDNTNAKTVETLAKAREIGSDNGAGNNTVPQGLVRN